MKEQQFIIGITVGYMLKVMKARKNKLKFRNEFASIRHGNFPKFISLVNGSIPEMVLYNRGNIEVNPKPKEDNFDFVGLLMAGPSMRIFYEKCVKEFGVFHDHDISDEVYYQIALYEITIRIHANKFETLKEEDNFQIIISNLCEYLNLNQLEVEDLQKGRKLLNAVKHGLKRNYSWSQGLIDFEKAFKLTEKKGITLE